MSQKRDNTTPSCAVCQRRKVKCNRVYPCAACTKSGLECTFTEVSRDRKRAKRTALQHHNATHDSSSSALYASESRPYAGRPQPGTTRRPSADFPSPSSDRSNATANTARLIDGRYVNNHLYRDIVVDSQPRAAQLSVTPSDFSKTSPSGDQTQSTAKEDSPRNETDSATGKSFLFDKTSSDEQCPSAALQLPANHVILLWQTYLKNIDPIMKIAHAPTVQQIILGQIGTPKLPKTEEALIAATYFVTTVSMTEEECQDSLQASRASLLRKFREATEFSMSAAGFVTTTDIVLLQALILYLAGLRSIGEMQYVWSLMGLAIRIAGTIGLARDGTAFDLSPFDIEMRRRLWWSLVYFDGRMAEMLGQDGDLMGHTFDANPPSNLNDVDLFPAMKHLPNSHLEPTEAIYLQARNICLMSARELQSGSGIVGTWHRLQGSSLSTPEKRKIMETIERRFFNEIIRTCDPTVPLQWMSINTAKTFMAKLRLVSRIPIVHPDQEWASSDGYSDNAFLLSLELVQLQLDLWCEPGVQHWRWHWQAHFQWYALTCLLKQTRLRYPGPDTSKAWGVIKRVFEVIIPSLELEPKKSVLLDGIHNLLNMARNSRDARQVAANHDEESKHLKEHSIVASQLPSRLVVHSFSVGEGAPPHGALLPGMSTNPVTAMNDNVVQAEHDYTMLGMDLDAIDWAEFDRLAAELIPL